LAVVIVARLRTNNPGRREAIIEAVRANGLHPRPGAGDDIVELWLHDDGPCCGELRRSLAHNLDRHLPDWQADLDLYWPL
jgi:hypothetical protein